VDELVEAVKVTVVRLPTLKLVGLGLKLLLMLLPEKLSLAVIVASVGLVQAPV